MQKLTHNAQRLFSHELRRQWLVKDVRRRALRSFHTTIPLAVLKPFILADIGEGIREVQIIQWFVQPGARVEQFDKLCEVQSDKASVEITSRFDGIIKKLYYEADDTAQVGKPLCDIDIQGDIAPEDEALIAPEPRQAGSPTDVQQPQKAPKKLEDEKDSRGPVKEPRADTSRKAACLATPAVRGLLKELNVHIEEVTGTGRDGRVSKGDVHNFVTARKAQAGQQPSANSARSRPPVSEDAAQRETPISLSPVQAQMFKVMTRSLSIPHFVYADEVDLSALSALRKRLNDLPNAAIKLSFLPFVIKAVSIALDDFPLLNARVEPGQNEERPKLIMREKHNIGVAMDTPQGLLVPNIKNVAALSILDIADRLAYLQSQAKAARLTSTELTGGTITVSNIGSIGGTYVSPVIVQSEVAILGVGRARAIPAFDDAGNVVKKIAGNFSWSADHRVVDGATMGRMGERVRALIEEPALMMARLR